MANTDTAERKIYFYRSNAGADNTGRPLSFDPEPALSIINALPFIDNQGRYLLDEEYNALCCWVDGPDRARFGRIRRSGLPQWEQSGNLRDLDVPADSGLVEQIHLIFFHNSIVGSDFNFYGPRISRFAYYLQVKANGVCSPLTFEPLLRHDVAEQLKHLSDIWLFDLKVRASYASVVKEADEDLGAAFEANRRLLEGAEDEIEVILRPKKNTRSQIFKRLVDTARNLVHRDDLRTEASKFILRGKNKETGKVESVDLLKDQLIARKQIIRQSNRSRALDSESAYAAIQAAYEELEEQLEAAASIT